MYTEWNAVNSHFLSLFLILSSSFLNGLLIFFSGTFFDISLYTEITQPMVWFKQSISESLKHNLVSNLHCIENVMFFVSMAWVSLMDWVWFHLRRFKRHQKSYIFLFMHHLSYLQMDSLWLVVVSFCYFCFNTV